jgi:Transposase
VLLVGIDWAERHHDVCLIAADGDVVARERIPDGVAGVARLHELIARHASDPAEVVVGIETDRGLLVGALVAAGYRVIAVNPLAASRYRERHTISGAKSDRGDARMLADLVRTDRHHHRPAKGDSGAGRGGQGAGPRPSAAGLGPSTPGQHAAQRAAGVLPGSPGRLRQRPWWPRRGSRAEPSPESRARSGAVAGCASGSAAPRWPPASGRGPRQRHPGCAGQPAVGGAAGRGGRLRPGGGGRRGGHRQPDRAAGRPGGRAHQRLRCASGRSDRAQSARAWGGAGGSGAGRVRRRPQPLRQPQGPARLTPAPLPSPGPRGCGRWCWPGRSGTGASPPLATCGPSPR